VLGLARVGVVLAAAGLLVVVASGLWLVEETAHSLGDAWLTGALALLTAAALARSAAAPPSRHAGWPSAAPARGTGPTATSASCSATVARLRPTPRRRASLAVLAFMVWRPGASAPQPPPRGPHVEG
jgi:hypothetical protein